MLYRNNAQTFRVVETQHKGSVGLLTVRASAYNVFILDLCKAQTGLVADVLAQRQNLRDCISNELERRETAVSGK